MKLGHFIFASSSDVRKLATFSRGPVIMPDVASGTSQDGKVMKMSSRPTQLRSRKLVGRPADG
jgi:hypothetical protein